MVGTYQDSRKIFVEMGFFWIWNLYCCIVFLIMISTGTKIAIKVVHQVSI